MRGLTVDDDGFEAWRRELDEGNRALAPPAPRRDARNHGFQNTVVRVRDQYGVGVDDHLLEFYEDDHDRGDLVARLFHESAIRKVHKYSGDASYRSVYVDCTRLARTIDKVHEALSLSITAYPELDERTRWGSPPSAAAGGAACASPATPSAGSSRPTAPRSSPCSSPGSSRRRRSGSATTGGRPNRGALLEVDVWAIAFTPRNAAEPSGPLRPHQRHPHRHRGRGVGTRCPA